MTTLRLVNFTPAPGSTVLAVSWQIATDMRFRPEHIEVESLDDEINIYKIIFTKTLDPTVTYYARANVLLNTGYRGWSNIDMVTPDEVNDIQLDLDMPSPLTLPTLFTNSDVNNHIQTMFTITVGNFGVVGTAKHSATTYAIERIDNGELVWYRPYETVYKEQIVLTDKILQPGRGYRIRAVMHSTSGDSSQIATRTIVTGNNTTVRLLTVINDQDVTVSNVMRIMWVPGLISSVWTLNAIIGDIVTTIWTQTLDSGDVCTAVLPADTLKRGVYYILSIQTNLDNVPFHLVTSIGNILGPIVEPDNTLSDSACCNDAASDYQIPISESPLNTLQMYPD